MRVLITASLSGERRKPSDFGYTLRVESGHGLTKKKLETQSREPEVVELNQRVCNCKPEWKGKVFSRPVRKGWCLGFVGWLSKARIRSFKSMIDSTVRITVLPSYRFRTHSICSSV